MEYIDLIEEVNNIIYNNNLNEAIDFICSNMNNEKYKELVYILIDAFQLYGFVSENIKADFKNNFLYDSFEIKMNTYRGKYLELFNQGQLSLVKEMSKNNKTIISAPTSFGKTSLVIEYFLENLDNINNAIFILPTKSLIEELYIKLLTINKNIGFKYYVTVNILKNYQRSIRILTPEKFLTYYEYNGVDNIDFIIMDEIYKIENDGRNEDNSVVENRALKFRKVLEIISKEDKKIITLSPYTYQKDESMNLYMKKFGVKEINRNIKYVKHNYIDISNVTKFKKIFGDKNIRESDYNNIANKTYSILNKIKNSNNVIYVSDYSKAIEILDKLILEDSTFINKRDIRYENFLNHLVDTYNIENTKEWYVTSALRRGIGIYISSMPRYVKKEIINLFENNIIKCLIVTTAFIEGVNSSADNMIITSAYTARNIKLNDMALLNISGRAGRFGKKFIGNIFFFNDNLCQNVKQNSIVGVKLSNPNYMYNDFEKRRNDFEIEIIDEQFLNEKEKNRKLELEKIIANSNLDINTLKQVAISSPISWKVLIYNYLSQVEDIHIYKEYIDKVTGEEESGVLEGIENIFHILKKSGIPFDWVPGTINAFGFNDKFIWGEMYKSHISGNIKKVLINKKRYIIQQREKMSVYEYRYSWIREYFKGNEFNDNKLYEETFKFISNIIEYKIPYYISLFVNLYYFYIKQNNIEFDENSESIEDIIEKLENMGIDKNYIEYYDYGFSKDMIDKMKSNNVDIKLEESKLKELKIFDEYELLMIKEYKNIMGII